jgi:hypothetical protein
MRRLASAPTETVTVVVPDGANCAASGRLTEASASVTWIAMVFMLCRCSRQVAEMVKVTVAV